MSWQILLLDMDGGGKSKTNKSRVPNKPYVRSSVCIFIHVVLLKLRRHVVYTFSAQ